MNKIASDYETYEEYCKVRKAQGLQVIPETLWTALREKKNQ